MRPLRSLPPKPLLENGCGLLLAELNDLFQLTLRGARHLDEVLSGIRFRCGQGRGDFVSVVKALKDINYDGYLAMELGFDRRDIEPDLVARQALEYLKPLVDQANAGKPITLS